MSKIFIIVKDVGVKQRLLRAKTSMVEAEKFKSDLEKVGLENQYLLVEYNKRVNEYIKNSPKPTVQNPAKPRPKDYPEGEDLSAATKLWNKVAKRNKEMYDEYEKKLKEFKSATAENISDGKYSHEQIEDPNFERCFPFTYRIEEVELDVA